MFSANYVCTWLRGARSRRVACRSVPANAHSQGMQFHYTNAPSARLGMPVMDMLRGRFVSSMPINSEDGALPAVLIGRADLVALADDRR